MSLLILGGTADGRILAERLHERLHKGSVPVIYSIAGLVRTPNVECDIVSGGFTQFGGLADFIRQRRISSVLDVTHPYAEKMSTTAVTVCKELTIPCWRFHRPAWQPQVGDQWVNVKSWNALLPLLREKNAVFLSAGQIDQAVINALQEYVLQKQVPQKQVLRTAVKPDAELPESMEWIKAIGPFTYEDELNTIQMHNIDAIVSKNSGGESTSAKLTVARELGMPVYMFERPALPDADEEFSTRDACADFVTQHYL